MALALDGSGHNSAGSPGSSLTVSLTTSVSDSVIVVTVLVNDFQVTSITASNIPSITLRKRQAVSGGGFYIEEWQGVATGTLSSETITVNFGGTVGFATIDAFGISGADTSTVWDSNGALPDGQTTSTCSITTSNADDFLIGTYRFGSEVNPTQGAGWTKISGANGLLTEYKIVSATQSGTSVTIGTGNGDQNAGIGDAVIQAGVATRKWIFGSNLLP